MTEKSREKLQQLVFDENKVVSIKLLTEILKININDAKKYLQDFFDSNRSKLNVYYVIIGLQKIENKQSTKVIIVAGTKLEDIRKSFISVTSCHIYCIHKGELVDKASLISNYENKLSPFELNKFSAIQNSHIQVQSPKKHTVSPQKASNNVQAKNKIQEKQVEVKKESNNEKDAQGATSDHGTKSIKKDDSKASSKSKGTNIFSMFQKQADKKHNEQSIPKKESPDSKSKQSKEKTPSPNEKEDKGKKDIKQLFSKQIEKGVNVQPKESSTTKSISSSHPASSKNQKKDNKRKKTVKSKNSSKQKSDSESDEETKPKKKKHRRIVEMESESESENEESLDKAQREQTECEPDVSVKMAPVDDDEEECIPPTQSVANGKIKKWKDVTKTFTDDNGFFVTKRVREYVTASEESGDEESKTAKQQEKPKEIVNKTTFANKKQSSLTSFFKQK